MHERSRPIEIVHDGIMARSDASDTGEKWIYEFRDGVTCSMHIKNTTHR